MKCSEVIFVLEKLAPASYACEWDNVGLLAGRMDKEVKKIFIALDATDEVIRDAKEFGADLLLTHHPLIFKPLKTINDQDFISRRIMELIHSDISYYAMHTNFDAAPGCMADLAADMIGITDGRPLEVTGEEAGKAYGIGKVGKLKKSLSLKELAELAKKVFQLPFLTVYGGVDWDSPVDIVAVSPGSGGSMVQPCLMAGAQVMITGDIGHHTGIDAAANHMAVIDAGHYGLEHIFIDFMEGYLWSVFGNQVEIKKAEICYPAVVL